MGDDPLTGKNCDHRKGWIEDLIQRFAAHFAIDVLSYSVLSNHHHQLLRSRPDVVRTWDDTEVARRWLMICPARKDADGKPLPPTTAELDKIRNCPEEVAEKRLRLSDVSWWMRLLNQRVAQAANNEDEATGRFFADRFKGIPLIDEESVLACSVYVDLNWIRACLAETLEMSDYTSAKRRVLALRETARIRDLGKEASVRRGLLADSFLSPVDLCEASGSVGPQPCINGLRCSDKGFLPMSAAEYLELLDWSARQVAKGKPGRTPGDLPPILQRMGLSPTVWLVMVAEFEDLFSSVAGLPEHVDQECGLQSGRRFYMKRQTRELFSQAT